MKTLLFQFILIVACAVCPLHSFEISGRTHIVIAEDAPESTRLAAQEFSRYIGKVSGGALRIVRGGSDTASRVMIGILEDVPGLPSEVVRQLSGANSPDAFAWVCHGDTLFIVGKDRVGEVYGTYAFLDEKIGIRWFRAATAGDEYEYIPDAVSLQFTDFAVVREPAFRYRALSHVSATGKTPVNGQTVAVRQGFQISPPWNCMRALTEKFYMARCSSLAIGDGGHTAFSRAVPQTLYESHPEYFALQDGKRAKGEQICISNPEVRRLVLEYVESLYGKFPPSEITFLFGMQDTTTGWCECAGCRKLDETADFDHINVSNRFHRTATDIMAELYRKYPDARLESWAYHTYRTVPDKVKYDPRALIYYCAHGRCYGHTLQDPACERNAKQLAMMKAWSGTASRMRLYDYANCTPVMYGCLEAVQVSDLRFYRKMGWEGWKEEMLFADADFWPRAQKGVPDYRADRANSNWQWHCVMGKLLWNPDLEPEKVLEDVESKYYGKAYPAMKKYHAYRRELWNNSPYCLGYPTGDERRPRLLSVPGAKERLLAYLDEAEKLAANDKILLGRLKDDRTWLVRYWIEPNEQMRRKNEKSCTIPRKAGTLKIDDNPDDPEWNRAWHTCDFKDADGKASETTQLAILADRENLYFRFIAADQKHTASVHEQEVEFFIVPPSPQTRYYHVSVNSSGAVYEAWQPGNRARLNPSATAAVQKTANRLIMEVKVPLNDSVRAERGDLWKIHITHTVNGKSTAFPGEAQPQNPGSFRAFNIGLPIIQNGTFEMLDENGKPRDWVTDNCSVVASGGSKALKLSHRGYAYQLLAGGLMAQKEYPRKIRVSFRTSGKGTLHVAAHRYNDTADGKAKHGYRRKNFPTTTFCKVPLTSEQKFHSCEYTINANEWIALRFYITGSTDCTAILDDVAINR